MRSRLLTPTHLVAALLVVAAAVPTFAGTRIEEVRKLEPGGRFVLDSDAGSVTLVGDSSSGARIVVTSERDDLKALYDLTFEESPGLVRVTVDRKKSLLSAFWQRGSLHFEIHVPERTAVEVGTGGGKIDLSSIRGDTRLVTSGGRIQVSRLNGSLNAETSGGEITLTEVVGDTTARTSGGTIEAAGIDGSLDAETSGGDLLLRNVSGDIRGSTSGGGIDIEGAGGKIVAKTSGGGVEAKFAAGNARGGDLETMGGGIRVVVDGAVDLTLDAATSGGSVTTGFAVNGAVSSNRSSLKAMIGKGGEPLRLRTMGGSIRIDKL
jgi:hypothetical protein